MSLFDPHNLYRREQRQSHTGQIIQKRALPPSSFSTESQPVFNITNCTLYLESMNYIVIPRPLFDSLYINLDFFLPITDTFFQPDTTNFSYSTNFSTILLNSPDYLQFLSDYSATSFDFFELYINLDSCNFHLQYFYPNGSVNPTLTFSSGYNLTTPLHALGNTDNAFLICNNLDPQTLNATYLYVYHYQSQSYVSSMDLISSTQLQPLPDGVLNSQKLTLEDWLRIVQEGGNFPEDLVHVAFLLSANNTSGDSLDYNCSVEAQFSFHVFARRSIS